MLAYWEAYIAQGNDRANCCDSFHQQWTSIIFTPVAYIPDSMSKHFAVIILTIQTNKFQKQIPLWLMF